VAPDVGRAILNDQIEFRDVKRLWPDELAQVTQRCLAKVPADRFHSGRDLACALRSVLKGERHDHAADSIAVLPFTNTGGAEAEYLSDGIAETLINNLAGTPKLRVVPRSTAFRYKNTDLDTDALGLQLDCSRTGP
jgi:hypothetical protein